MIQKKKSVARYLFPKNYKKRCFTHEHYLYDHYEQGIFVYDIETGIKLSNININSQYILNSDFKDDLFVILTLSELYLIKIPNTIIEKRFIHKFESYIYDMIVIDNNYILTFTAFDLYIYDFKNNKLEQMPLPHSPFAQKGFSEDLFQIQTIIQINDDLVFIFYASFKFVMINWREKQINTFTNFNSCDFGFFINVKTGRIIRYSEQCKNIKYKKDLKYFTFYYDFPRQLFSIEDIDFIYEWREKKECEFLIKLENTVDSLWLGYITSSNKLVIVSSLFRAILYLVKIEGNIGFRYLSYANDYVILSCLSNIQVYKLNVKKNKNEIKK